MGANISYYDPYVSQIKVNNEALSSIKELTTEVIEKSDCVLILTDHGNINYDIITKEAKLIVDTRNAIKEKQKKIFKLGV